MTIKMTCESAITEVQRQAAVKDLPAHLPKIETCLSDSKMYDNMFLFCTFVYPSLYVSVSQLEEVKRELGLQMAENKRLSSKISKLETTLSETDAILKMKTQEAENKIHFLEDKISMQNKAIAKSDRDQKDKIDALQTKLDQAKTEAEMLMKFIQQSDELESVDVETKSEQGIRNDIDLENIKALVVGGHENFLNKLRQRFPNWAIPGDELFTSEPTKTDVVIYIPLHCGHSLYAKGRAVATNTNAYELYTQSVNIEAFIKEVKRRHLLWNIP